MSSSIPSSDDKVLLDESVKCPATDCNLPIDVVLRSSDKLLIGAHQDNLAQFSEGFPSPSDVKATDDPVDLTEDSSTLRLLVQFMHKQRYPNLSITATSLGTIFNLAEAAEKYLVYSAMIACNIRIDDSYVVELDPSSALKYGVKFNYPEVANRAALWCLTRCSVDDIVKAFGPGHEQYAISWIRFREMYVSLMDVMTSGSTGYFKYKGTFSLCTGEHWHLFYNAVLADLPRTPRKFLSTVIEKGVSRNFLAGILDNHRSQIGDGRTVCGQCRMRVNNWSLEFFRALTDIRPFDTFL